MFSLLLSLIQKNSPSMSLLCKKSTTSEHDECGYYDDVMSREADINDGEIIENNTDYLACATECY